MGIFDSIGNFFSGAANDVMSVVTKPISAITSAVSGGVAKVTKPVTDLASSAMNDVTKVASTGIQTAGQTFQGAVGSVTGAASNVLSPLAQGIGGGVQALGSGIGGGVQDLGAGAEGFMEYLPIVIGVGVVGFLFLENESTKRGGQGYLAPAAKRLRLN